MICLELKGCNSDELLSNMSEQRTEFEFGKFAGVEKYEQNKSKTIKGRSNQGNRLRRQQPQNESFLSNGSLHYKGDRIKFFASIVRMLKC